MHVLYAGDIHSILLIKRNHQYFFLLFSIHSLLTYSLHIHRFSSGIHFFVNTNNCREGPQAKLCMETCSADSIPRQSIFMGLLRKRIQLNSISLFCCYHFFICNAFLHWRGKNIAFFFLCLTLVLYLFLHTPQRQTFNVSRESFHRILYINIIIAFLCKFTSERLNDGNSD